MRVLAIIAGIIILLPGLCTLGFGFMFASSMGGGGNLEMIAFPLIWLTVGGLLTWAVCTFS